MKISSPQKVALPNPSSCPPFQRKLSALSLEKKLSHQVFFKQGSKELDGSLPEQNMPNGFLGRLKTISHVMLAAQPLKSTLSSSNRSH